MNRALLNHLNNSGPMGVFDFMRDRRQAEADRARLQVLRRDLGLISNTSLTDAGLYPLFCQLAANDDQLFARFRRSLIYRGVLEHVTKEQGDLYLAEIQRSGLEIKQFQSLFETDTIGNPYRYSYVGEMGLICPSTLRYCKVASDLGDLFGSLNGMRIAEIGVGYGGQLRVIDYAWLVQNYTLFDIPEVLVLANLFLSTVGVDILRVDTSDGRDPESGNFDLLISNYAFSELNREVQEVYMERVVQNSSRGYVTYNHITPPEWGSLSAEEFAKRVNGAQILPEKPLTSPKNVIVVWGMND